MGKVAHPIKIMVWGAISYNGCSGLHFHDENVNSEVYQECIEKCYIPALYEEEWLAHDAAETYIFMQDGARCHMSNATEAWLMENLPKNINFTSRKEWPPNSPDLNVLETLWAILQDRVVERGAYTEDELCEVISDEWWKIPQDTIRKLYDGIPERIAWMVANGGGRFSMRNLRGKAE